MLPKARILPGKRKIIALPVLMTLAGREELGWCPATQPH
jgi:hypothetical protein